MENFDFCVIGGGSGGLAAAKEAASHGAKTVLFDFVDPTVHGTKWGLGGTCVNVGCIPKKLFHYASRLGEELNHDANHFGWKTKGGIEFEWETLRETVVSYIKSLNFSYKVGLRSQNVRYINAKAKLTGPNQIQYELKGEIKTITANRILIAVGGRPQVPSDVPGATEFAITSDDLFYLTKPPGKTLCVGASYISLECGGFLTGLGYDVTVAVRSIVLRSFDRQCSEKVAAIMEELGTKFYRETLPQSIEKQPDGKLLVTFIGNTKEPELFDTVIYATGRKANLTDLGLEAAGVNVVEPSHKIKTDQFEKTSAENIYAIGDACFGRPELTPTAIAAGEILARRLFLKSNEGMDYDLVPTTVFTPFEYGSCGLSEEAAIEKFGANDIEVFLFEFSSLSHSASHREKVPSMRKNEMDNAFTPSCFSKLVCRKSDQLRVLGYHCIAPNAGETTQGFAVALKMGARKCDFDSVIGIHPTDAESFTTMTITKASGQNFQASAGCGGGKCG